MKTKVSAPSTANLELAFDVGHSSIGWAVLKGETNQAPELLGCGSVIFQADDCLASERRGFRRQRRHIRATRLRIDRMRRLFAHLGVLTRNNSKLPAVRGLGCSQRECCPASEEIIQVSCSRGAELWDVLRWYAHNRGYDGNKGWSKYDAASSEA